jgi:predicted DNA-binding transcriptional regulator AlpA
MTNPYVGVSEIKDMLGISRQRVDQLANEKGFPDPITVLKCGRIWMRNEVREWALNKGRVVYD